MIVTPILFSTNMVLAILEGRKTQTRRTKGLEEYNAHPEQYHFAAAAETSEIQSFFLPSGDKDLKTYWDDVKCPFGKVGDILWVREAWCEIPHILDDEIKCVEYKAGSDRVGQTWKPSIHLPKTAARIWLQLEQIGIERLQDISEQDAKDEGIDWLVCDEGIEQFYCYPLKEKGCVRALGPCALDGTYISKGIFDIDRPARFSFQTLWDSINGFNTSKSNPWVWVVKFNVLSTSGRHYLPDQILNSLKGKEVNYA